MSQFTVMPFGFTRIKTLKANEKLVAWALQEYADKQGKCFPSLQRIADDIGISKSTVIRSLKVLEQKGFLKRQYRKDQSNVYELDYSVDKYEISRCQRDTGVVSERHWGGVCVTPEPYSDNHIQELKEEKPTKPRSSLSSLEIDDELSKLATEHGKVASKELDSFKDYCEANGKRYKNYRAAFKNWLRKDFGYKKKEPMFGVVSKAPLAPTGDLKAFDMELHRRKQDFDRVWASLSLKDKDRILSETHTAISQGKVWGKDLLREMKRSA